MKQKIGVLVGLLAFIFLLYGPRVIPQLFIYNHTESIPKGWYLVVPSSHYEIGDIVGYDVPEDIRTLALERGWIVESDVMMKRIGALSGDSYEITQKEEFWVRGKYIGKVFAQDYRNLPMPSISVGKYYVEEHQFLPITTHPFSFDGRYYGSIPLEHIKFKAIPITAFHF